jgi:hypothetical protein
MTNRQVLMIIAAFVTLTLGSFIWYIATWDAEKRTDLLQPQPFTLALFEILPPEAPTPAKGGVL